MRDVLPVWSATVLAVPLGAGEADYLRQLAPIDRVIPAVLGCDRHVPSLSHVLLGGNQNGVLRLGYAGMIDTMPDIVPVIDRVDAVGSSLELGPSL